MSQTGVQFGRIASLLVGNQVETTDLSALRFRFEVKQSEVSTPNTLIVRIYNLSPQTVNKVVQQYTSIKLQVGYVGTGLNQIFSGDIKYFKKGKESGTDRFLEITAGDNDFGFNYGNVNQTLEAGATPQQVVSACADAMGVTVDKSALDLQSFGGAFPRGKVLFGLARVYLDQVAATANAAGSHWYVENGVLKFVSTTGYLPGTAVVLSPSTGLIGIPEFTIDGVECRCLMNGAVKIGTAIQLAPDLITQTLAAKGTSPAGSGIIMLPNTQNSFTNVAQVQSGSNLYRVAVAEHSGDSRGQEWYTDITALSINPSAPAGQQVSPQ